MALIKKDTKIGIPISVRVKEFNGNSGHLEEVINKWLEENCFEVDKIIDIKMSTCQYREGQTKTTALVIYKPRQ